MLTVTRNSAVNLEHVLASYDVMAKHKEAASNNYILSSSLEAELKPYNSYEDRLQTFISQEISKVSEVEYIFCQREEQAYYIWILINELDPEVRKGIYKKERGIIQRFPTEIFDFYIIARMNRPAESVIHQSGIEIIYDRYK